MLNDGGETDLDLGNYERLAELFLQQPFYEDGSCVFCVQILTVNISIWQCCRFLDITLTKDHNITTGKIYNQVRQISILKLTSISLIMKVCEGNS